MGLSTSIMWLITAIFTNTMNLSALTYYNSLITILFFVDIISFGAVQSAIVCLAKDKKSKQQKLQVCSMVNVVITIIGVTIIIALREQILFGVFGLEEASNQAFYYMMLCYIAFMSITKYYERAFRAFDLDKYAMTSTIINALTTICGFCIVYLTGGISLNFIPLIFFLAQLLNFVYMVFVYKRELNIKIFKISFKNLSLKELGFIISRISVEFAWQIAYTMEALFLLKLSVYIYDTYSYFENVLDILANVYFAFMYICSVQISRRIGERKYDDAFQVGKWTIYISIWTWVGYLIISGIIFYPLMLGLNTELFETGMQTYFLYVFGYFLNFVEWCLYSYIMSMGGKTKAQIILYSFLSVYYITLYVVVAYLPTNIFFAYGVMYFSSIAMIVVNLILFKRKNWTGINDVKAIVFDFDDTLYSGVDWEPWNKYCKKVAKKLLGKNVVVNTDEDIVKNLIEQNKDVSTWLSCRDENGYKLDYSKAEAISNKLLQKLKKNYRLFIASNSSQKNIIETSKLLGIDLSNFEKIYVNQFDKNDYSKKPILNMLMKENDLVSSEVLMVGDSQNHDIHPAKDLGLHTMLVKDCKFTYSELKKATKK